MNDKQLEATAVHLVNRRESSKKGSPAWKAACEAIGDFIEKHPDGAHYVEDYTSNLGTDVWNS